MNRQKSQFWYQAISDFFQANNFCKKTTLNHFKQQNVNSKTIYRAIKRYEETGSGQLMPNHQSSPLINTPDLHKKIKRKLIAHPSVSVRDLASQLGISKTSIQRAKTKMGVITRKKQKKPKYVKNQEERCKTGIRKLYKSSVPSGGHKSINPPSLPQCRPIETYWALCKAKYKKKNVRPKNLIGFTRIWKQIATEVAETSGKNLFEAFRKKMVEVYTNGPLSKKI